VKVAPSSTQPIAAAASSESAAAKAAPSSPLKVAYLAEIADVQKKVMALAEAIPENKYGWRPAAGVRSTAEVFLHIAGGNYYLVKLAGTEPPAGVPAEIEKLTAKKDVLAWLDKSFAHLRTALDAATPEQLDRQVDFFGEKTTGRGLYLKAYGHVSEHLGQAIAYARSNGIAPPWSRTAG